MGGSSKGTVAPEAAQPISTVTDIGSQVTAEEGTYDEEEEASKRNTVDQTKLGTRGLRIPEMASTKSTTSTAGNLGITI